MNRNQLIIILFVMLPLLGNASMFCPPDKNMLCSDDRYDLDKLGRPIVFGPSYGHPVRFADDNQLNSCNVGYIYRRWYVDYNNDQIWQNTEPFCVQTLHFSYENYPISVQFPQDKVYSCKDDIKLDKPTWVTGPCNVLGYSYTDMVFEVSQDACYKIQRMFKVIDWCDSDGDGIMNTWFHTQTIKVIDQDAPVIQQCQYREYHVGSDCKAEIKLSNLAVDDQACGAQDLEWTVWIDLWADGTFDEEYSKLKTGPYFLAPVLNGETIEVNLPNRIGIGNHKVHWSVKDACGNIKSCHSTFTVVDKKPPTPYLRTLLTAAFDATTMPLMVPARIFNIGSFDNCSPKHKLKYSFSEDVNDTIRVVNCSNAGFQFYTLYVTDMMGNQEVVDVYLLAFDNGSCNVSSTLMASMTEGNGAVIAGRVTASRDNMNFEAGNPADGVYSFINIPLYSDFIITPECMEAEVNEDRINVLDLIRLQEYILGKTPLTGYEWVAADVDGDRSVRTKDLVRLRKILLTGLSEIEEPYRIVFEPGEITQASLPKVKSSALVTEYDGTFDFKAVLIGDITEANALSTENRNAFVLKEEITEEGIDFYLAEDVDSKGFELEIGFSSSDVVISSDVINLKADQMNFDDNSKVMRVIVTEKNKYSKDQPLFSLKNVHKAEYTFLSKNGIVKENDEYSKFEIQKAEITENEFHVYPNPLVGNEFTLSYGVTVNNMTDDLGRKVGFLQSGNKIVLTGESISGILFVYCENPEGNTIVKKVIKL
ncbi:MAG: dockerin type I repeat-containing protein [Saprospiraceae bacterium]|nr:dockerin type I repeat-containing protein [Saprospiraceae bacterium]